MALRIRTIQDLENAPRNNRGRFQLQGADLQGAQLEGANLLFANIEEADLRGAILQGANLTGAQINRSDLRGANLQNSDLSGTRFNRSNLEGADLRGATILGTDLRGILRGVNLENTTLRNAILADVNFEGANLNGANLLETTNLRGAYIEPNALPNIRITERGRARLSPTPPGAPAAAPGAPAAAPAAMVGRRIRTIEDLQLAPRVGQVYNLRGFDLEGAHLERADMQGAHLENANMQNARLWGANLEGAHLENAVLTSSRMIAVQLNGANLQGADLQDVNAYGINLQGANLQGADLSRAVLIEAQMQNATLQGANLQNAEARFSQLQGANLEGANLRMIDLRDSNLQDAIMIGVDLQGSHLGRFNAEMDNIEVTNLSGANLQGARMEDVTLDSVILENTNLQDANLARADLQNARFNGANLQGANLEGVQTNGVTATSFETANLTVANLQNANLQGSQFIGSILVGANLQNADIRFTNFQDADLRLANLQGINFRDTNLQGANIGRDVNLPGANLEGIIRVDVGDINLPAANPPVTRHAVQRLVFGPRMVDPFAVAPNVDINAVALPPPEEVPQNIDDITNVHNAASIINDEFLTFIASKMENGNALLDELRQIDDAVFLSRIAEYMNALVENLSPQDLTTIPPKPDGYYPPEIRNWRDVWNYILNEKIPHIDFNSRDFADQKIRVIISLMYALNQPVTFQNNYVLCFLNDVAFAYSIPANYPNPRFVNYFSCARGMVERFTLCLNVAARSALTDPEVPQEKKEEYKRLQTLLRGGRVDMALAKELLSAWVNEHQNIITENGEFRPNKDELITQERQKLIHHLACLLGATEEEMMSNKNTELRDMISYMFSDDNIQDNTLGGRRRTRKNRMKNGKRKTKKMRKTRRTRKTKRIRKRKSGVRKTKNKRSRPTRRIM